MRGLFINLTLILTIPRGSAVTAVTLVKIFEFFSGRGTDALYQPPVSAQSALVGALLSSRRDFSSGSGIDCARSSRAIAAADSPLRTAAVNQRYARPASRVTGGRPSRYRTPTVYCAALFPSAAALQSQRQFFGSPGSFRNRAMADCEAPVSVVTASEWPPEPTPALSVQDATRRTATARPHARTDLSLSVC